MLNSGIECRLFRGFFVALQANEELPARAEQRLNEISEQMGTPEVARDADRLIALNDEYQQTETLLRTLYEEWDRVSQPAPASS